MKLMLNAFLIRKKSEVPEEPLVGGNDTGQTALTVIQRMMDFVDEVRKSGRIKMGGVFHK